MLGEVIGGTARKWKNDRGAVIVDFPVPGVFHVRFIGHVDTDLQRKSFDAAEEAVRAGFTPLECFVDNALVETYDPVVRTEMTEWMKRNRPSLGEVHILNRSKLVSFGITMVNLLSGGNFKAYSDTAGFEAALASIVRKAAAV